MFPGDIEVDLFDGHVFMEFDHVEAFVVIGPSEQKGQELHHGGVQLRDVADVLQKKIVYALIREHELVELGHHFLELVVSSYLLEQSWH